LSYLVVGNKKYQKREYKIFDVISFAKVSAPFGGLHCMAPNYPIYLDGLLIRTCEHLYQALAFPDRPDIQKLILEQSSPMTAKMKMKENIQYKHKDWDKVKVSVMKWCLMMKLLCNWKSFGTLLAIETNGKQLVEYSKKDIFWGAIRHGESLIGVNALGRLLMGIREEINGMQGQSYMLDVPDVDSFLLLGKKIEPQVFDELEVLV
jgi:ribA/ribD-fused uncharacterized protein